MFVLKLIIYFILCLFIYCKKNNYTCTTPNGELGRCIPVYSCDVIRDAISTRNTTAIDFAQKSQCDKFNEEPHVCCGTYGYYRPIFEIFDRSQTADNFNNSTNKIKTHTSEDNKLPDKSVCGLETADNRIIGGKLTEIGEFPWMVLLYYKNKDGSDAGFQCGGAIINNRYILTAAHCLKGSFESKLKLNHVRLGEWNTSSISDCYGKNECADPVIDIDVEEEVIHPYFNAEEGSNDIALIRLKRNFEFTEYIRPICIPPSNASKPQEGTLLTVSGWGTTSNGTQSEVKLKVQVPLIDNDNCKEKVKAANSTITINQMCAGGVNGKDTCKGDSGGPLMHIYQDQDTGQRQWYQEGIVSRGIGCGSGYPAVYTRVARYTDWILNNLEP